MTEAPVPPSYSVATSLPTYEEAERTKEEEARRAAERPIQPPVCIIFKSWISFWFSENLYEANALSLQFKTWESR